MQLLFEGSDYSRAASIQRNIVCVSVWILKTRGNRVHKIRMQFTAHMPYLHVQLTGAVNIHYRSKTTLPENFSTRRQRRRHG